VEYSGVLRLEASLLQQGEVPITTETTPPDTKREAHSSHRADTDLWGREYWLHKLSWYGHGSLECIAMNLWISSCILSITCQCEYSYARRFPPHSSLTMNERSAASVTVTS